MIPKLLGILGGLIGILLIVVVVLVFAVSGDYQVEREITINKPKADVFSYAKMVKNQNEWGPWIKKDPAIKMSYKGNDGEVGFVSSWESEVPDVGVGEQEIKKLTEGSRIDTEIRFRKPFESKSDAYLILDETGPSQTRVRWGFSGSMPKPMNLLLLVMNMDKEVGKDFESGLASLKAILERK